MVIRTLVSIIIFAGLCSCSPKAKLSRILKKHPDFLQLDTITLRDTILRQGSSRDSSFIFSGDTVYLRDGRQEIKYFYNTTTKHHYIKGDVKADTIIYEKQIPIERVILKNNWTDHPASWAGFLFIILIVFIAFKK